MPEATLGQTQAEQSSNPEGLQTSSLKSSDPNLQRRRASGVSSKPPRLSPAAVSTGVSRLAKGKGAVAKNSAHRDIQDYLEQIVGMYWIFG